MAKQKTQVEIAPKGSIIIVTKNGSGAKRKGQRHEVLAIIKCHGRSYYRCKTDKGIFHLSPSSAAPVKKVVK